MTLYEAKKLINDIYEETLNYQNEIKSVQGSLMDLKDNVENIRNEITTDLHEETIEEYSMTALDNILSNINTTLSKSKTSLTKLSEDATKEVKRIVDEYNSSLDKDSDEERLSYITITLAGLDGIEDEVINDNKGGSMPAYHNSSTEENEETFDYYFSLLSNGEVYSSNIPSWNSFVGNFLEEYGLSDKVDDISIEGKVVKCKLKNGEEHTLENVYSVDDLLKEIYKIIEE